LPVKIPAWFSGKTEIRYWIKVRELRITEIRREIPGWINGFMGFGYSQSVPERFSFCWEDKII
jgi:hypothetical protein